MVYNTDNLPSLLNEFNDRQEAALSSVYDLYYGELMFFTSRLCAGLDLSPTDILHDVFIKIWEKKTLKFDSPEHLKGYLYVSIKNRIKNHVIHRKHVENHRQFFYLTHDSLSQIIEPEVYSLINHALELLPAECAKVLRLHLEGWNIREISRKLDKSESTVYKQRSQAIDILKKKMKKSHLEALIFFL